MTQTKKDSSPLGKLIVVGAEQFGCQVLQTTKQLWKRAEIFSFQKEKTRVKEDLLKWREDCVILLVMLYQMRTVLLVLATVPTQQA